MPSHGQCRFVTGTRVWHLKLVLCMWPIILCFVLFARATYAGDPEFIRLTAKSADPAFAEEGNRLSPSFSADGRYSAIYIRDISAVVVRQRADRKELFRVHVHTNGLLKPTFSPNGEFLALHNIYENGSTPDDQHQLIVYRCSTGEKIFKSNLLLWPSAICFSNDWIIVAGECHRSGMRYCCQIIRADNGSDVANLVVVPETPGLGRESLEIKKIELDDTHLLVHSLSRFSAGFFGGTTSDYDDVTFSWDWKRVLDLSQQGENIVAVGSR